MRGIFTRSGLPVLVGILTLASAASAAAATKRARDQAVLPGTASVVICHAAGGSFTRNEVNVYSIVNEEGHGGHANDIIPPFHFRLSPGEDVRHYPGKNWDAEGEAIWTNGCSRPSPPPPPEPPAPIGVFVTCVENHGSSYDAVFGYDNENPGAETIPIGPANHFSPAPAERGQPATFMPGRFDEAVEVTGVPHSVALKWTLAFTDTRMAIATADFGVKCHQPAPAPRPLGIFATCATRHGSTYDATFGYVNENAAALKVPIGARNSISPGPAGQGQPESFAPGFVDAAFAVRGIPISRAVTWRLELGHEVRVARATADLPSCLTGPIGPVGGAAISKSIAPRRAVVGQRVTSTIVLRNNGSEVLEPAELEDVLRGARLRILSVAAPRGQCRVNASARIQTVRCRAPTLAPGESLTVRITAKAIATGTARDRATILGLPGGSTATGAVQIALPPSVGLG